MWKPLYTSDTNLRDKRLGLLKARFAEGQIAVEIFSLNGNGCLRTVVSWTDELFSSWACLLSAKQWIHPISKVFLFWFNNYTWQLNRGIFPNLLRHTQYHTFFALFLSRLKGRDCPTGSWTCQCECVENLFDGLVAFEHKLRNYREHKHRDIQGEEGIRSQLWNQNPLHEHGKMKTSTREEGIVFCCPGREPQIRGEKGCWPLRWLLSKARRCASKLIWHQAHWNRLEFRRFGWNR